MTFDGLYRCGAFLWAGSLAAALAATTEPTADYLVDSWQTEDGLPQSSVMAIVQTPDGYLWLATFGGLARFDGVRFTVFDTGNALGLPSNRLTSLHADPRGRLWLVTEFHDLAWIEAGRCRRFGVADGLPPRGAEWVDEDAQGNLWLADHIGGLHQWDGTRFVRLGEAPAFGTGPVLALANDGEGGSWVRRGDRLARFEAGHFAVLKGPDGSREAEVTGVGAGADGGLWLVTADALWKYRRGQWLGERRLPAAFQSHCEGVIEDAEGTVWLASYRHGLFRSGADGTWQQFTAGSGLTTASLRSLFLDREGGLWIGTDGGGLHRIKPRRWRTVTRQDGLGVDAVHSLSQDARGRIWFAGGTSKPYWLDQGAVAVAIESRLTNRMDGVFSVLAARDGTVWIGVYRGQVFRYAGGELAGFGPKEGMRAGSVRALFEDRQGNLWIGGFAGLSRIRGGEVRHFCRRDGLSEDKVWALAEDAAGTLYVGTSGGGLNVFRDGRFTAFRRGDGLPSDDIAALYMDAENTLWIGTCGGGLSRLNAGRFARFATPGGLPARSVGPILEDRRGFLWMASDLGLLRASKRELNEFAQGRRHAVDYVTFGPKDGLASTECAGIHPACLEARDGTVWFGTAKGAAFVDPKTIRINTHPPPVAIEAVRVDDQALEFPPAEPAGPPSETGPPAQPPSPGMPHGMRQPPARIVTIGPLKHRIEFHYTALTFTVPERARFRYRLEGWDPDWIEAGTRRVAYYTRVAPGHYAFRVIACNNDGIWNEAGARLEVSVLPAWHQTWWFRLCVAGACLALVVAAVHYRTEQHRQMARLRARIAGDVHDEVGSNLGSITVLSELSQRDPALPEGSRAALVQIHEATQHTARAIRDIVWFIDPDFDTLDDLVARMRAFAATLLGGRTYTFDSTEPLPRRRLSLEFRRHVLFGFKELLHNVVRHARASEIRIGVTAGPGGFEVQVRDNGCGFDAGQPELGHGLRGLRQRAAELGGSLRIESQPGCGTTATFTVRIT
jgi:ligand-binding sensor domain-containing protein/signal transduction histidine kinase